MNSTIKCLVLRNIKLYFKDKGTFFTSLISPMILLVLFITFLGNVYENSLVSGIPEGVVVPTEVIKSFTSSWLFSSLLGVSAVTVAFCSNIIMAQDKVSGAIHDLTVAPIKKSVLAISYFVSNVVTTLLVCFAVTVVGLIYISTVGWYYTAVDVLLIFVDVILAVLFGCSFAALVENFVSTQGGIGAVSSLISSLYGFICGAYMPVAQFGEAVKKFVSILPGTYSIGLLRTHYLDSVMEKLAETLPSDAVKGIRDSFDINLYFGGKQVEPFQMYTIVLCSIAVFIISYIIINKMRFNKHNPKSDASIADGK